MNKEPEFVNRIVDLYESGKSQKEIVVATCQTYSVVLYWLKKREIYSPNRRVGNLNPIQETNQRRKNETLFNYSRKLAQHGFAYVEGYKGSKFPCKIACLTCNKEFERVLYYFSYKCPCCIKEQREVRLNEVEQVLNERKLLKDKQRELKEELVKDKEYYRLYDAHICSWCNKIFTIKEYEDKEGKVNVNTLTHCSSTCIKAEARAKKKQNQRDLHGKHRLRAIKYGVRFEKGISLKKLIQRDGMVCSLCGGLCSWDDVDKGICGPTYPSIDHIVPMSRGGEHSWNNVQVAHRSCNTMKGAKQLNIIPPYTTPKA